jgi:hypothetical protein
MLILLYVVFDIITEALVVELGLGIITKIINPFCVLTVA